MSARVPGGDRDPAPELSTEQSTFALWYAFLGGPVANFTNIGANYAAVTRDCVRLDSLVSYVIAIVTFAIAIGALLTGISYWRRLGECDADDGYGVVPRARFMAVTGIIIGIISVIGLVMETIPVVMLAPCLGT